MLRNRPSHNPLFWLGEILLWTLLILGFTTDLGIPAIAAAAVLGIPLTAWAVTVWMRDRKAARA